LPAGTDIKQPREAILKDERDEWHARVCCYAFGLNPQGFVRTMNKATPEAAERESLLEGIEPYKLDIKTDMDKFIRYYMEKPGYEFVWADTLGGDAYKAAQADQIRQDEGQTTINEIRMSQGKKPLDKGGDIPIIKLGNRIYKVADLDQLPPPSASDFASPGFGSGAAPTNTDTGTDPKGGGIGTDPKAGAAGDPPPSGGNGTKTDGGESGTTGGDNNGTPAGDAGTTGKGAESADGDLKKK
jgi:hypothetical protein